MEASFGNGFLERLEHRQQYKLNGLRQFTLGRHELTLFGIGYYGTSDIPGLIPINVPVPGDTIDNWKFDRTHTVLLVATDNWKVSDQRQFSFSGFFRNYALTLRSNFGDGLIQQSESRNVAGGEATYVQSVRPWLSLLAGVDVRRDAPRNLDLKHVDDEGDFQPVTSNNLTLSFVEPFVSLDGSLGKHVQHHRSGDASGTSLDGQSGHHQSAEKFQQTRNIDSAQRNANPTSTRPLVSSNGGVQLR